MEHKHIIERKARIFNIQKYSIYDGPGIRTLVFFKGCPLKCRWCSNPESIQKKYQIMYLKELCMNCGACINSCPMSIHGFSGENQEHYVDRSIVCIGCGKCESVCPKKALQVAGMEKTISEVLEIVRQDTLFYNTSGGGITLGGGEVSMQPEFATNLLMECKMAGIHTAIETCGYAKFSSMLMIGEFTDLFLYDLKHIDSERHYELTGVRNERILENLKELLVRGFTVKVRMPLMKGLNDDEETIRKTIAFLMPYKNYEKFQGIDLLPYHKLGINKYKQLDLTYTIEEDLSLTDNDLERIENQISQYDFPVKIIRH